MTRKYDYIKLDYSVNPNKMVCEKCKQEQVFPEGTMHIQMFMDFMESFAKIHKRCLKK